MAKKKPTSKKTGPYLAAAFFCESVIEDKQGTLSVIRIIDTLNIPLPAGAELPTERNRLPVPIAGILSFRTGGSPGKHVVRVVMISPSGKKNPAFEQTLTFTEPEQGGANLILRNIISVVKGGLFWFNVYLDGKGITRMPLRIEIHREGPAPAKTNGDQHRP